MAESAFMFLDHVRHLPFALTATLLTAACGGSKDEGPDDGDGTVTNVWSGYCVATFTEDYEYVDVFGDVAFTAMSGEEYLISSFDGFDGEVEMLYLTDDGAEEFTVPSAGVFTSNCAPETAVEMYGVFADVTVYEDEALSTPLCQLSNGNVASTDSGTGFSTIDINFDGPTTYQVYLGGFADTCGADVGYVSVPETMVWGITTWLVPFRTVAAPPPE
jgi:hypothetical protein